MTTATSTNAPETTTAPKIPQIVIVNRGKSNEDPPVFVESVEAALAFADTLLEEDPRNVVEFSPWGPQRVAFTRTVTGIGALLAGGTSAGGRQKGAMSRDANGNLIKRDGTLAKPMGRPKVLGGSAKDLETHLAQGGLVNGSAAHASNG